MKSTYCALCLSVVAISLAGCGRSETASVPAPATPPVANVPPQPPPPSPEEQFENGLAEIGTTTTYRGPVATFSTAGPKKGKWSLTDEDKDRLAKIAALLKENKQTDLIIEGYTDSHGARKTNQRLSEEHAKAFENALVQQQGIDPKRIRTAGLGEDNPAADNGDPEGRARNQRVEIVFSSRDGQFAYAADQPKAEETASNQGAG